MEFAQFTMGIGDRFAHQGKAQLSAFAKAKAMGITVAPVWNKSFREHTIIHSEPMSVRVEADEAVKVVGWTDPYYVDADHINLKTVDGFMTAADFFTLDVADYIGKPADPRAVEAFVATQGKYIGTLAIPGIAAPFKVSIDQVRGIAEKYLFAVTEAGKIYRHVEAAKGKGNFITEVSMDETDSPQTPIELFFILAAIAAEGIPIRTIAPKFTGRFNKGVDFVGSPEGFEKEFDEDVCVIAFAIATFGLPADLKLSVHSGSDKFSIYGPINRVIRKHGCGLHLKTAGTTWLEELTGLAEAGGAGLELAKEVYIKALGRFDELTAPYATVIDVQKDKLPSAESIAGWTSSQFVNALAHEPGQPEFNPSLRQLIHVGYKVAAEMGTRYTDLLKKHEDLIGTRVSTNILEKHIVHIFKV